MQILVRLLVWHCKSGRLHNNMVGFEVFIVPKANIVATDANPIANVYTMLALLSPASNG